MNNMWQKVDIWGKIGYNVIWYKMVLYWSGNLIMENVSAGRQTAQKLLRGTGRGWEKWFPVLLILGILAVNLKKMFLDFNIDAEYAITMSYRLAMGDHMFSQMREPHQTSAFLLAFFVKIWMWATGTTTGLVLYINAVSLLAKLLVVLFLYHTLKKYCSQTASFLAASFLAISNAKIFVTLDFSNMQIYSAILLFCCLARYLENQRHRRWLILSALCLCLEILSYPSCLLVYFIVMGFLLRMSERRLKDCLLFSAVCGALGLCYIAFFGFRLGFTEFFYYIREILAGDGSHAISMVQKIMGYGHMTGFAAECCHLLLLYAICAILAYIIVLPARLLRRQSIKPGKELALPWGIAFFALLEIYNLWSIITVSDAFMWTEGYFPLILLGIFLLRYCSRTEKRIFWLGTGLGLGCVTAVLLLTNLTFATAITYLIPGITAAFIPIERGLRTIHRNPRVLLYLFLVLILFQNFYTFMPMSFYRKNILSIRNVVKSGPAIGIISDYMGPYTMNTDLEEWPQHIRPGDRLLLVSTSGGVSTLPYLYQNVEISAASTISTPTYDEKLLQYWEQNPDKLPNVVVVDCWFGQLNVEEDSWIMQWIYEEFGRDSYQDGAYHRYYRRPDAD